MSLIPGPLISYWTWVTTFLRQRGDMARCITLLAVHFFPVKKDWDYSQDCNVFCFRQYDLELHLSKKPLLSSENSFSTQIIRKTNPCRGKSSMSPLPRRLTLIPIICNSNGVTKLYTKKMQRRQEIYKINHLNLWY